MNDDAREKFRAKYRAGVSPHYSGFLHAATVVIGASGLIWWAASQITEFHWSQLWFVVGLYVVYNVLEWASHRYLGHEKTKLFKFFYQRHTGDHHTFFVDRAMEYELVLDWRVVIFPVALLVAVALTMALPAGAICYWVFGDTYGYLAFITIMSCYLAYEVLHFSYHLPKGSVAERIFRAIPGWTYLRLFHTVHHNRELMAEGNFNITLPLSDWLFGTLYFDAEDGPKRTERPVEAS